jgi:hypothetical protein
MFGSKQASVPAVASSEIPDESLRIHTIPKAFYGKVVTAEEAAPVLDQRTVNASAPRTNAQSSGTSVGSVFDTPGPSAQAQIQHAPAEHSKKRMVLWVVLGVGILAVAGTATWFYTQAADPAPAMPEGSVVIDQDLPVISAQDAEVAATSTTTVSTTRAVDPDVLLQIPAVGDTIDFDGDGLTDIEEELYKTDPAIADTDLDTFTDGVELTNLFDPLVEAPGMLTESPNVQRYTNPVHNYALMHPRDWLAAPVDEKTSDEVTFTSLTGEFVTIQAFPFAANEVFVTWFATHNPSMQYAALTSWENRVGLTAWYEPSFMRFYFVNGKAVYVMEYHPGIRTAINFRRSIRMMADSFAFTQPSAEAGKDAIQPPGTEVGNTTVSSTASLLPTNTTSTTP